MLMLDTKTSNLLVLMFTVTLCLCRWLNSQLLCKTGLSVVWSLSSSLLFEGSFMSGPCCGRGVLDPELYKRL